MAREATSDRRTEPATDVPQSGDLWRAPSAATFRVVDVTDGMVTVDLHRNTEGERTTLKNHQRYSVGTLQDSRGWERVGR